MFYRFNLGEIIGANIKARRKAAGMTQIELANKCGCYYDSQPVREWEHGRVPKLETLERIADGLSCYVSELLPSYYFPPKKHGWISVKDRLPDPDEKVIVYNAENEGTYFARRIESDFECWDAVTREFVNWRWIPYGYTCITLESVTHWMQRPKPPEVTP